MGCEGLEPPTRYLRVAYPALAWAQALLQSLSEFDENQGNGDKSTAISMENFICITDDVPAPMERVIPKGSTKKPQKPFWNRFKDQVSSIPGIAFAPIFTLVARAI